MPAKREGSLHRRTRSEKPGNVLGWRSQAEPAKTFRGGCNALRNGGRGRVGREGGEGKWVVCVGGVGWVGGCVG